MGKNTTEVDSKGFRKFVKDGLVAVDFWAAWCGPCKIMGPIFDSVAGELKHKAKFGKLDVDANHEIAQEFNVRSIPTIIFFKDGEMVDQAIGVLDKEELIDKINEL